jgi:hypothetical protein
MAKDILYIQNGEQVDALWTNHVVISNDGVHWSGISKHNLTATQHSINLNTSAPNSFPERNKESGFVLVLKRNDAEGAILKFNVENVLNQPTWLVGTPAANINVAMADVLGWLAV